jgi:hypothetical protein
VGIAASTSSGRASRVRQSHFRAALCVLRGESRMEGTGAHENTSRPPWAWLGRTIRSGLAPRAPARKTSTPPPRCDERPLQPNVRFAFSAAVSCRKISLIARSSPPCLPGVCTEKRPRGPLQFQERGWSAIHDCPGPPARLSVISVLCSKSSLHGAFCMGAQERLATQTRRVPAVNGTVVPAGAQRGVRGGGGGGGGGGGADHAAGSRRGCAASSRAYTR